MVWPNFFLMNVFFALKGSKPFIIISIPDNTTNFYNKERIQGTTSRAGLDSGKLMMF